MSETIRFDNLPPEMVEEIRWAAGVIEDNLSEYTDGLTFDEVHAVEAFCDAALRTGAYTPEAVKVLHDELLNMESKDVFTQDRKMRRLWDKTAVIIGMAREVSDDEYGDIVVTGRKDDLFFKVDGKRYTLG